MTSRPLVPHASAPPGFSEEIMQDLFQSEGFRQQPSPAVTSALQPPVEEQFFDAYFSELRGRRELLPPSGDPSAGPLPSTHAGDFLNIPQPVLPAVLDDPLLRDLPPLTDSLEFDLLGGADSGLATSGGGEMPMGFDEGEGRKKRLRTPKQQELNKLAQQRYRERRKQRFNDMEEEVRKLNEQLEAMKATESQNVVLTRRNTYLEKLVALQQEEIRNLKTQLEQDIMRKEVTSSESASAESRANNPTTLRTEFDTHARALEQFLETNSVESGTADVPEQSKQLVQKIVRSVCEINVRLISLEVPNVGDVIDRDANEARSVKGEDKEQFEDIIRRMDLSSTQEHAILDMRADHLTRMRKLYAHRQSLNMKAMGLMLPHPLNEENGPFDPTVQGKMNCMEHLGYFDCHQGEKMLKTVLDDIKDNLRKEQLSFLELGVTLLQCILNPVQAAILIVGWYPRTLDALSLANTLASMSGVESINLEALSSAEMAKQFHS